MAPRSPRVVIDTDSPLRVEVLAFDGCYASEVFAIVDVLSIANQVHLHLGGRRLLFDVTITSVGRRSITTAGGTRLSARPPSDSPDLLLVPGFELLPFDDQIDATLNKRAREIAFIRAAAANHLEIAAVCVGAFLVGEAGLLDGRRCTTAWAYSEALARRYPTAIVDIAKIIVNDDGVTTAAAFSAAGDLAMHLVRTTLPPDAATVTGKLTLMTEARPSQRAYIDERLMGTQPATLSCQVATHLERHITEPYDLDALAAKFNMSTRTLLRKFNSETGMSPLQRLQHLRVARAKQLLETTSASLEEITFQVGYRDSTTFRRLFQAHAGLTPAAYRQRFSSASSRAHGVPSGTRSKTYGRPKTTHITMHT